MLCGAISMNPNNFRGCSGIKPYLFFFYNGLDPILDVHAIELLDVRMILCVCVSPAPPLCVCVFFFSVLSKVFVETEMR